MPRVLIVGCGYAGGAAADLFHSHGWQVEGWTASAQSASASAGRPYAVRAVDITDGRAVAGSASEFDAVIQCVSSRGGDAEDYRRIYFDGARHLARSFPEALLLFTSSSSVYAQTDGEWVTESAPANPTREASKVLRETEEFVLGNRGVVARLAGIYGPGRSALLRKFLAGTAVIDGAGPRYINQAHRDDIAAALFLLVQTHLAGRDVGQGVPIFNVADFNPLTERECYEWLAAHLGRPVPPTSASPRERKRGNTNKRVSAAKLHALGWAPRFPDFRSGMSESVLPCLEQLGA